VVLRGQLLTMFYFEEAKVEKNITAKCYTKAFVCIAPVDRCALFQREIPYHGHKMSNALVAG
jgi:hypothetical protein